MSLISYSQNHEDVMLYRALRHIKRGFYIDVGANDPVIDSVTKIFYERGWSGINIEPTLEYYEKLSNERPRDINLCCAVSSNDGIEEFYEVCPLGLSTLSPQIGKLYALENGKVKSRKVDVLCLNTIIDKYQLHEIHFLKIDVEGSEQSVLEGLNLLKFRPWILLIESVSPIDHVSTHANWEILVLESGYKFVYADGLNRFYIAEEHFDELHAAFTYPPNVFDGFTHIYVVNLQDTIQQLHLQIHELSQSTHSQINNLTNRNEFLENEFRIVSKNSSFKWTNTMKKINLILKKLIDKII